MSDYADKEIEAPIEEVSEAKKRKGSGSGKSKLQYGFEDGVPKEQQEHPNNNPQQKTPLQRKEFTDHRPQTQSSLQLKALADRSPQAQQALQLKEMVDRSQQAQQALQLKERLDNSSRTQEALRTQQLIQNSPRSVVQREYIQQFSETNRAVQFDGGSSGMDTASIHKTAQKGVEGKGGKLPHLGKIQKSFGKHDVTQAQAYTGPKAASAAKSMGAQAYATQNKVAFAKSNPSLHTTAHEAAHLVQQGSGIKLKGGVGQKGDPYERHADAVADRVVARNNAKLDLSGTKGSCIGGDNHVRGKRKLKSPTDGKTIDDCNDW